MNIPDVNWTYTPSEAIAEQKRLSTRICLQDQFVSVDTIAGIDVGFEDKGKVTRAAVVVMSFPQLQILERRVARCETTMPYIPGLLSYRELPAVLKALRRVQHSVDLFLCDGQGFAHPRRLGIASHLGVLLDKPTIGIGKSRLVGQYQEPDEEKGSREVLWDGDEQIGVVLRSRTAVKPIFVSPGHRMSFDSAVKFTLDCLGRYRLPEPIRAAHHLASVEKGIKNQ
jgi:deoxyribonuclease V